MLLFTTKWSSSSLVKLLTLLIGVSLLMLAFFYLSVLPIDVPQIAGSLTKYMSMVPYLNGQTVNSSLANNAFLLRKKLVFDSPEAHLFTSPYITAPKNYNTSSTNRSSKSARKQKVISCFNCPNWFKTHHLNQYNRDFKACPYSECIYDPEGKMQNADVVLFFVGYMRNAMPPDRPIGQIWVKCYWESPVHYNYPTPYELWKSAFNWTFTYRTDSDIFAPNNRLAWRNSSDILPDSAYLEIAKNKTRNVVWFVSNCKTQSQREIYVKELKKYVDVDIFGQCGDLSCSKSIAKDCESHLSSTYRFYLSFENSLCQDYVTEKFFRNIQHRTHVIPVVRGGFDYKKYIPSGTFVDSANFISAKDLALYLKELGCDHDRYAKMLKEKDKLSTLNYKFDWCDICEKVHTDNRTKVIRDIREWSHKGMCHNPVDIGKSESGTGDPWG